MANIVILTSPIDYPYHTIISTMIQTYLTKLNHTVSMFDINFFKYDHECLTQIKELQSDVIITLDLTGFRFRSQAGETALNMLPTKILNLIWGNKPEYASVLNKKISLSMLFYDASGINYQLPQIYPNLLYYKEMGEIMCSPTSDSDVLINCEHFQQIWSDFTQEVLLPEA